MLLLRASLGQLPTRGSTCAVQPITEGERDYGENGLDWAWAATHIWAQICIVWPSNEYAHILSVGEKNVILALP